jgi:hypothetical protein
MKYASDNVLRLIERWRFLIGLAIILAVYAIALIAFLTYRSMEEATFSGYVARRLQNAWIPVGILGETRHAGTLRLTRKMRSCLSLARLQ